LPDAAPAERLRSMSHTAILIAILVLFLVEVNHLKWIWWNHWHCRTCGVRNRDCACSEKWKWMVLL
jgi:hypothetical protein